MSYLALYMAYVAFVFVVPVSTTSRPSSPSAGGVRRTGSGGVSGGEWQAGFDSAAPSSEDSAVAARWMCVCALRIFFLCHHFVRVYFHTFFCIFFLNTELMLMVKLLFFFFSRFFFFCHHTRLVASEASPPSSPPAYRCTI